MTNLASALLLDPSIQEKVIYYSIGLRYKDGSWDLNEFNSNNDRNAVKCLFQAKNLDWHIMTATTSRAMKFHLDQAKKELKGRGGVFDFILDYWIDFVPNWKPDMKTDTWIMWDIAVLEAVAHPHLATEKQLAPPKEIPDPNPVMVYVDIKAQEMIDDFWKTLAKEKQ
jgi:inosine-uridine nucleoside N-ribohydrolase